MKRLIRFCQKENIYPQVYYYTKRHEWDNSYNTSVKEFYYSVFNLIIEGEFRAEEFFGYAFGWNCTSQGKDFWRDISVKWQDFCRENKIKLLEKI